MRFLHDNKVMGAVLTPSSENANYPASNLKDPRLSRHLRFIGDVSDRLLVDSGGLLKDIFQATVNRLENSGDLTLWATANVAVTASGLFYDGSEFVKLKNIGAATGLIYQAETGTFTTLTPSANVICRKGSTVGNKALCTIWNSTRSANVFSFTFDFDNYPNSPGTPGQGTLRWYRWIDSQTVELHYTCSSLVALTDDLQFNMYASPNATVDEYTYWMRPQLEDLPYDTPYVNGSRSAVSPNHTFEMPEKLIFKVKVKPWFAFDVDVERTFLVCYKDSNHRLGLIYSPPYDAIICYWKNGGTGRFLTTPAFNGTYDINGDIILFGAIDLSTQTGNNTYFGIVDGVKQAEDNAWGGALDAYSADIIVLQMGHMNQTYHVDSQFESVQFWAWDGSDLGTLDSEADIDAAMAGKPTIFEQIYQPKIKASYAALAGHNLSADALIKVQGNDWNSWNGSPFEQTLVWDADIILKSFAEKEYPYWHFVLNDPNNADGYIKLGLAYLGPHYEVEEFPDSDLLHKAIDTTKTSFSDSGQAYSRVGVQYKTYEISMGVLQEATRQGLLALYEAVGLHEPFFLLLDENSQDKLPVLYCKLERGLTYRHAGGYLWRDKTMRFREVF